MRLPEPYQPSEHYPEAISPSHRIDPSGTLIPVVTVADLMAWFGVGRTSVIEWIQAGKFPGAWKNQGRTAPWRIPLSSAVDFSQSRRVVKAPEAGG